MPVLPVTLPRRSKRKKIGIVGIVDQLVSGVGLRWPESGLKVGDGMGLVAGIVRSRCEDQYFPAPAIVDGCLDVPTPLFAVLNDV